MRPLRLAKGVAVLFAQRMLENVSMEVLVLLCNKAVEWAASSPGARDRLLRTLDCGLRATLLNKEFMQSVTVTASTCVPLFAAYTISKGIDAGTVEGAAAAAAVVENGAVTEEVVGVQQAAEAAELLPPWLVFGTSLAARLASCWLVDHVLNLHEPSPEELEMVPLSGRLRRRLPSRGRQDLLGEELSAQRVLWVDDLQGRPQEVRVEEEQGVGAVRLAREVLAQQAWGEGVAVLAEGDPVAQHATGIANKLLGSVGFWLLRRHGSMSSGVVDNFQDWVRAAPSVGLAVVAAGRANTLGFTYRKRPGGGIAFSRPVTLPLGTGTRAAANEEILLVHGCNYGPAIVVEKQVMLSPAGPGVLAHELTHLLCRHTAEDGDALVRGMLDLSVRGMVYSCLQPFIRRAAARAVGCDLRALSSDGSAGLRPRILFTLGTLVTDFCMAIYNLQRVKRLGAPLFVGPQLSNTSNLGLVHEMEAEQGALLLLARAGYDPMSHSHVGNTMAVATLQGKGDATAGMAILGSHPAAALHLSEFDLAHQWPDPDKVAWAHAQVLQQALEVYKAAAVEGQNSSGSTNAE